MGLPEPFTTASPLVFNVDYFDWSQGAGYIKYYLLGTKDDVGEKFSLTTDSSVLSSSTNWTTLTGDDLDFDLTFNAPVDVAAAIATINYTVQFGGTMNNSIVWTIYHYDGTTETSLGTATITVSDTINTFQAVTVQIPLISKHFAAGDILRVNAVVTQSHPSCLMYYDPAGSASLTIAGTRSGSSSASINVPFEVQ